MTLADAVAALRALAVIPTALLVAADARPAALTVFAAAALSDAVDGWLARRSGPLTARGAFVDPLADKILVVGSLIVLAAAGRGWPVTVVAALVSVREAIAIVLRARALRRGLVFPADTLAKAKTVMEMAGIALIVVGERPWAVLGTAVVGVAFVIGVITLPRYLTPRLGGV